VLASAGPTKEAIPSVSIVFNASASAALSVAKESSQTVEFQNSSTISSSHPPLSSLYIGLLVQHSGISAQ
jgi:hypothetical protein